MKRQLKIPVSPGEVIDKITILEIKADRIEDKKKRSNVKKELTLLQAAIAPFIPKNSELAELRARLKTVNATLWDIEDDIRECERRNNFGPRFIELARSVYHSNDHRAVLKRAINNLLKSEVQEEKSYAQY